MKMLRKTFVAGCLLLWPVSFASPSSGQEESKPEQKQTVVAEPVNPDSPHAAPGIAIGETLPSISLLDQEGTTRSIQEIAKQGPVALVFYRSASW